MTSKRRENKNLVSFICFSFLVISFSKQLLIKIRSKEKSISQDLLTLRNRLKRENTLYLKTVLARNILLMRRMFWCFKIFSVNVCLHSCRKSSLVNYAVGAAP